jgi:hypothetical protein
MAGRAGQGAFTNQDRRPTMTDKKQNEQVSRGELTDEQLDQVAGGDKAPPPPAKGTGSRTTSGETFTLNFTKIEFE